MWKASLPPAPLKFNNLGRLARHLAGPALLLFLSLAATWPLATAPGTSLPMGTETSPTVPLFNVWTVWWNAQSAGDGYAGYWDAPIFIPHKGAFAFSESMPLSIVAAPVIWATGNHILAYNFLLIVGLCLNGWAAFTLLGHFNCCRPVQWTGGAMITLLPLIHSWLGVIQLVPVFGILWTLSALIRFARRPKAVWGLLLGIAFSATYLMCAYYGLFLLIPMALSSGWLIGSRFFRWDTWRALGLGLIAAGLICSPFALHQARTEKLHAPLSQQYLAGFSALAEDYLVPPRPHWSAGRNLSGPPGEHYDGFRLCPGFLKLALAAAGIGFGLANRRDRRLTLFCLTLMGAAFALSLGPWLRIWGWQPYMSLADHVPGFGQARNVFRFAILVHLMVVVLAMTGLQGICTAVRTHIRPSRMRSVALGVVLCIGVGAVVEILPSVQPLYRPKASLSNPLWVDYLAAQTDRDSIIACIPFPFRPDVAGYEQEARWMYWQTFHHRQMVNGYSGYFPAEYLKLKMAMAAFPAPETLPRLRDLSVDYCVVKRDFIFAETARQNAETGSGLELVFEDDPSQVDIYRLPPNADVEN